MFKASTLVVFTLLAVVHGQQVGTFQAETHPPLSIQECTAPGSCTTQEKSIVLDSNWRWLHSTEDATHCYNGNTWNANLCPDPATCSENCAVDGADYTETYGLKTNESALSVTFVTRRDFSANIGSRVYLMEDENSYKMFNLKNQEFTFDVDMSQLPCGLNGALYFVQMDEDGGLSRYPTNKAGAKYGTGYCDTQCPRDIKFINGLANVESWNPSPDDPNAGTGKYGTCCNEMDIWEANSMAAALTPHVCSGGGGQTQCSEGTECGDGDARDDGICDKDGCDFNSYRQGDPSFLGVGKTVDTSKLITVVTQFITADNTTAGALTEIRRIYVQDGKVIQNSKTAVEGMEPYDSITDEYCAAQKTAFGDTNSFANRGGMAAMGDAFEAGMVLVMSIWDDHAAQMLWLDGPYPPDKDLSAPGVTRGACSADSGKPEEVELDYPRATVIFSNIKYGAIGSTYAA